MKRYEDDYGMAQRARDARWLRRREAARVVAAPLPKRTTGHAWAIARPLACGLAIVVAWTLVWLLAFNWY